jgi:hypothetical protein
MTDREIELKRLNDVAWNTGVTSEQLLEQRKSPELRVDAVLDGLPRTPDNAAMLYKFIASATDLSAATRQELCFILDSYFRTTWSKETADEFKTKHPLKDEYEFDPNFINIPDVEERVRKSGFLNQSGPHLVANPDSWGLEYAIQVLQTALGDIELNIETVQRLHMSICRHWSDVLNGFNRTNLGDDSLLSRELRLVRICSMKFANAKNIGLAYPADFGIFHQLLF